MLQKLKPEFLKAKLFAVLMAFVAAVPFALLPALAHAAEGEGEYPAIGTLMKNVTGQIWGGGATVNFITILFYIIGIVLLAKGLLNAKKQSEGGQGSGLSGWLPIFGPIVVGAMMMAIPTFADYIFNSMGMETDTGPSSEDLKPSNADCATASNDNGQYQTIGAAICGIYKQVAPGNGNIWSLINFICIIVGVLTIGSALTGAYKLSTNGQGAPKVSGIVWRAIGGAMLLAFPAAIAYIRGSLFDDPTTSANFVFSTFTVANSPSLDRALTFFVDNLKNPFINLTFFIFTTIGMVLIARTLYAMSGINFEQQRMTPTQMISRLIIGGCLVSSWSIYTTVAMTVMGGTPDAIGHTLAYSADALDQAAQARVNNIFNAALVWVQMIGLLAFFRGFMVLKSSLDGQGGGSISAGMTHLIAGALCINIPWTLLMIQRTIPGVRLLDS